MTRSPLHPALWLFLGTASVLATLLAAPSAESQRRRAAPPQDRPAVDRGETVLLMPMGGSEAAAERFGPLVGQLLSAQVEADALVLEAPEDWRDDAPADVARCRSPECSERLRGALGAQGSLFVALWERSGSASRGWDLELLWVNAAQRVRGAAQFVEEAGVPRAVAEAFASLRAQRSVGPGPYLRVTGTPEGAQVQIDGTPEGVLPFFSAITPGEHEVTVRLQGHTPRRQTVTVPENAEHTEMVQVALVADGVLEEATASRGGGDAIHIVGPAVLAAAGVTALVIGITGRGVDELTFNEDRTGGFREKTNEPATTAWIAAGSVATAAAVGWLSIHLASDGDDDSEANLRVRPQLSPERVGLTTHGTF